MSPTSVRYWVKRSTFFSSEGEALARLRISQPASGSCRQLEAEYPNESRGHGAHGGIGRVVVGKPQAVMPAHHTARLEEPARPQGRLADQQARAEADAAGELVGLGAECRADLDRG